MTPPRRAGEAAALAAVLAMAVGARALAFGGVEAAYLGDDIRYVQVAQNLAHGFPPSGPAEWFGGRVAFLFPVAWLFRVFGADDVTAVMWPFLGSLVAVVAAFLAGRRLAGPAVGLAASAIVAATPLEISMATRLRPDAVMPGLIALAVWAALGTRTGRSAMVWAGAAGALLGVAWSAREMAVVMAPVVIAAGWPAGRRGLAWGAVGATAAVTAAVTACAAVGADPLLPITGTAGASSTRNPSAAWSWGATYAHRFLEGAFQPHNALFLAAPVLIAAVVVVVVGADRTARFPLLWSLWAAAYLEFGTLANLEKPTRFLLLATIPAAVTVALAARRLHERAWMVVAALMVVASVTSLHAIPAAEGRGTDVWLLDRVAGRLRDLPPGPVVAESYTWQAKLSAFLDRGRQTVAVAQDPAFLTPAQRVARRRITPLPDVARGRGGYVVVAPVSARSGWPANWNDYRRDFHQRIPWDQLHLVATVGAARIYRWPDGAAAGPRRAISSPR
ncbi:MAG: glycosyltransferase family 39 protein [Thermoleophilia bacterium]